MGTHDHSNRKKRSSSCRISSDEAEEARRARKRTKRVKAPPEIELIQDVKEDPERMGPKYDTSSLDEILFETLPMKGPAEAAVAINKLFHHSHLDAETITHFLDCGGPGILLGTMNKWKQDGAVQLHGCRSILALIKNCPRRKSRRVAQCLVYGQALGLVLGALQRAPNDDLFLRMHALEAAAALTRCDGTDTSVWILRRFVEEYDGVLVVCKTMASFQQNTSLQKDGAFLLKQMIDMELIKEDTIQQTASTAVQKVWESDGKPSEGVGTLTEGLVGTIMAAQKQCAK